MQITLTNKEARQARQIPRCNDITWDRMSKEGRKEVSQSQRITSKLNPN